jgi:uncharacterized membrane protein/acyl-CoA synthetase (AMP-forming)/AMP-acid ligase II
MKQIVFYILAAIYPILVFCFLVIFKVPVRFFSLALIAFGLVYFLGITGTKKKAGFRVLSALLLGCLGLLCFATNSPLILKLYPILMNGTMLCAFGSTLFSPPSMIFRFAVLQDKSIRGSLAERRIEGYCRKVTLIWCIFFVLNGGVAVYSVFFASDAFWSIYNGGVSYILIGILFAGELIVRKMTDKKMPKAFPLSQFTPASRLPDQVLCYDHTWPEGRYKTWKDFLTDTARLRSAIDEDGSSRWILHAEDCWYFLAAFTALLQCGKQVLLTANVSPAYIGEIRTPGTAFLTDQPIDNTLQIAAVLENPEILLPASVWNERIPPIIADETVIVMYTSGTTGRPKAVRQRLTEFENDNRFILSKWGEEFLKRKLVSTVSQHHIYGLLFSILLSFTAGVPFRRQRIEFPEEFERLTGDSYMIITVPAFLKRAVEQYAVGTAGKLSLSSPWIFTSGGVLPPETAAKTEQVFGFWPVEVYGSTETSGIAWRQSKDGMEWMPFDNAQVSLNDKGCLVIRSPYIKDPAGFTTGDLADILSDGRFLLKGRADSIVKIEEKRVSLPEVENRILQSGFVSDVCVVAMEDRRQYLAAAVVLNEQGRNRFSNCRKPEINRCFREHLVQFFENTLLPKKWRYLDALPLDNQGKKKKPEIQALFRPPGEDTGTGPYMDDISGMREIPREKVLERQAAIILLEFTIPGESGYFNGHFPGFPILPAVAQIELVIRMASRYFGTGLHVSRSKRIKFSNMIRPGNSLRMELRYDEGRREIRFTILGSGKDLVYASGTLCLEYVPPECAPTEAVP